jgi:nicotinate dehydrogenase subunit B
MDTPFGKIVTTNLTPDMETGIGRWSFSAFQRAMREGISRDGHYLYPAFPYTAFAKTSDEDLTALYAYLMVQPAVRSANPATRLNFPFSVRPLMAGWNAMFHDPAPYRTDSAQTAEWNRGAYLVNGLGHCGACHTSRNAFGAERSGKAFLGGAMVDGWEAPALTALSRAPVPWTSSELYAYLRKGYTPQHGIAAGPMAPVVKELSALPDEDIRAMATYLASLNEPVSETESAERVRQVVLSAQQSATKLAGPRPAPFQRCLRLLPPRRGRPSSARRECAARTQQQFAQRSKPDNLIRTILEGIRTPAGTDIGFMPAFRHSLDDTQVAALTSYMRSRYAPAEPAWRDLPATVARLRAAPGEH